MTYLTSRRDALLVISSAIAAGAPGRALANQSIRFGGTGSAIELMRLVGKAFKERNAGIDVAAIPALGSSGGIRAVGDKAIDIAVSARPVKPEEAAKVNTTLFFRSPYLIATSHPKPNPLAVRDIARMFADPQAKWQDGTPVRVILRPRSESDNALIASLFPGTGQAIETARSRPEVPIAVNDQDNATMAESIPGSIVGMSLVQLHLEKRDLRAVTIDGKQPSLANMESGAYPYARDFYLVTSKTPSPMVEKFLAFLRSPDAVKLLRESSAMSTL